MSEFKGTKGPWVVGKTKRGHRKISAQRWAYFCKVYTLTETFTESERKIYDEISKANAQLISKAPEMLEMLKYLIDDEQLSSEAMIEEVKQIIKEATTI